MIVVDLNVLLYAHDESDPRHVASARWLREAAAAGSEGIGLALTTALGFIRITTDPRVYEVPRTIADAIGIVEAWFAHPNVRLIAPTERHWEVLRRLADGARARGPLVMDAHVAALALEHGAAVASADRDFRRFDGVRVIDPTAA